MTFVKSCIRTFIFIAALFFILFSINAMLNRHGSIIEDAFAKSRKEKADLDKEQLRTCLTMKSEMIKSRAEIDNQSEALAKLNEEIDEQAKVLEVKKGEVDTSNKEQVDEFNSLVDKYYKDSDKYKKDADENNKAIDELKEKLEQYKTECTGKTYFEKDKEELSQELGLDNL